MLGFLAQEWLLRTIRGLLAVTELPGPQLAPIGIGFLTALAVLAGFALPPLLQLARVPALRVLRRDVGPPPPLVILAFGPAVLVVLLLVYWTVPEPKLFAYFTAGLAAFVLALTGAGLLVVYLAGRLRGRVGVAWRFGVANLSRRRAESVVQLVAFGTGIMVLLLLGILRVDLNGDWQRTLPQNLPNYFFVNIPPAARAEFVQFLNAQGARTTKVLPIIRGRLTSINGKPVEDPKTGRASEEGFATREQNLTWSAELGADNRIVAGRWWEPGDTGKPLVSLASEFQESLGVKVGDQLTFDIAGEAVKVTVASIRKVKWDTFQPNFFIVFVPGVLEGAAGTYMTSAYFTPGTGALSRPAGAPLPQRVDIRHRRVAHPGAGGAGQGSARGAERVPVHPARRPDGAAGGRAVKPRRAALRERHAAHPRCESCDGGAGRTGGVHDTRCARRPARRARRIGRAPTS